MYTILLHVNNEWKICFDSRTPILGDIYDIVGKLAMLKLSNPEASYRVAKVEIL